MLTVAQAAERLGVSASLIYALCRVGKIRHERHGTGRGTIRIEATVLDEYRASCRKEAGATARTTTTAGRAKSRGTAFTNLDGARLLAAWKEQGAT